MNTTTRAAICLILAVTTALWSSGCATLFKGTTQQVMIRCNVPDASLYVDGLPISPGATSLECKADHVVSAEKPGYPTASQRIRRRAAPTYLILDVALLVLWVIPGVVALAVDFGTGAIYELAPATVSLDLQPAGAGPSGQETQNFCIFCGESLGPRKSYCGACGRAQ